MDAPSSAVGVALARWRDNLLDLTPRNPLLNLPLASSSSLTISHPGVGAVVERLLSARKPWSFWLPPAVGEGANPGLARIQTKPHELVCGDLERAELLDALTRMHQQAETDRSERGLHTLQVVIGLLVWQGEDGVMYRSPLVLAPVRLERTSHDDSFNVMADDGEPEINPALRIRLKQEFDFDLPALGFERKDNAIMAVLREIETAIAGLPGWQVEPEAVLALLPEFKAAMYRDLEENFELAAAHPLVRVLAGAVDGTSNGQSLQDGHEEDAATAQTIFAVAEVDQSQQSCLAAAARGKSLVLHGPPGSGKSQTLANLITDRLAAGKSILFVSDRVTTKHAVSRHLDEAGLSAFCLDLHGPHADLSAVLTELKRCLDVPSQGDIDPTPEAAEQLQRRRAELDRYLQALQIVREPLWKSAGWVLGELARCAGLPRLALGLSLADLTADWLSQAKAAVARLQKLWHIHEEGPDFPWYGFKADGRYTQKVRDDMNAMLERIHGRIDRLTVAARDYGARIGATGPVPWLLRIADALEASPAPPASLLTSEDLSQLAADLEPWHTGDPKRDPAREPLTARYGPEIWQLPAGTRARVEEAWHAVAPLLAPGDERGEALLSHQQQLRGWAADTQRRIPAWISEARTLEKWLGITLPPGAGAAKRAGQEDPSVQSLKRLHRLANLCVADNAPERSWITDAEALAHARKVIESNRPVFATINQGRAALLERYTEQFFELDLVGIAERLAGPYRSVLRGFNMQFRRDRRAVGRRCRTETLPSTWWQDVTTAGDLMRQKATLDAEQPARQAVLGRYEKGLATDVDAAERATRIAAEALDLARELGCSSLAGRLVEALSTTARPADKIRAALKRLHDSLGAWQHATDELKASLPMSQLPSSDAPLEECALSLLRDYARNLQATLNPFAAAVDPVLAHAKVPPRDIATLLADVRQVEELRAREETQDQNNADGAGRLGSAFKGASTDGNALRKMLSWTMRLRELFQARGNGVSGEGMPEQLVKIAAAGPAAAPSSRDLRQAKEQWEQSLHALENRFEPPGPLWQGKRYADLPLDQVAARFDVLRQRVVELADWVEWRHMPQRFAQLGLADFLEAVRKVQSPATRLTDVLTKAALETWLENIYKDDPVLATFGRQDHERLVSEHRQVSKRLLRHNAQYVARLVACRRPPWSELDNAVSGGRHETIAQAFEAASDWIFRVKPCFFMSPRSVSELPPAGKFAFDVVVFDDASDLRLEDTLAALYRARQAVIAGDSEQPSPAHFTQWEADSAADVPVIESLLGACLRVGLPQFALYERYSSEADMRPRLDSEHEPEAQAKDPSLALQAGEAVSGLAENLAQS
jgi:Protein of unknown function (DUF4011)